MRATEHLPAGILAGFVYAATRPGQTDDYGSLVEWITGAVGGGFGGLVPDLLEPATNPWHRSMAHSLFAGGGIVALDTQLTRWQSKLREKALEYRECRAKAPEGIQRFILLLGELLCFALAGLIAGVLAGYVSHLVLDAITPASLPVLMKGF